MKKLLIITFTLVTITGFGQEKLDPEKYYAKSKTVFLESEVYGKQRELQIFLPDKYFWESEKKFKVLYLFDARNQRVFNYTSGIAQFLSMSAIEPVIIVGIVSDDRWDEFLTPNNHEETLKRYQPPIGNADKLIEHIENEIEPYITDNYRVQDYRLAIGHSLGGTFVTYASMKSEKLFDYNIVLSPNYNYDQKQFVDRFRDFANGELPKEKVFFFANGFGDSLETEFDEPLKEVFQIFEQAKNEKIKWTYKRLDIENHQLTWLGVYYGLLNWQK